MNDIHSCACPDPDVQLPPLELPNMAFLRSPSEFSNPSHTPLFDRHFTLSTPHSGRSGSHVLGDDRRFPPGDTTSEAPIPYSPFARRRTRLLLSAALANEASSSLLGLSVQVPKERPVSSSSASHHTSMNHVEKLPPQNEESLVAVSLPSFSLTTRTSQFLHWCAVSACGDHIWYILEGVFEQEPRDVRFKTLIHHALKWVSQVCGGMSHEVDEVPTLLARRNPTKRERKSTSPLLLNDKHSPKSASKAFEFRPSTDDTLWIGAICYHTLASLVVILSILHLCILSLPQYTFEVNNSLYIIRTFCFAFFSAEFVLRWLYAPSRWRYLCFDFWSWIECISLVPYVVNVKPSRPTPGVDVLIVFRLFRLLRVVHFTPLSDDVELIQAAVKRSQSVIELLLVLVGIVLTIFSSLIYYAEQTAATLDTGTQLWVRNDGTLSPFQSIPHSYWWCVITLTTVGYGDDVPVSALGRVVATGTMLVAVFVVTFPTTVLGKHFNDICNHRKSVMMRRYLNREGRKRCAEAGSDPRDTSKESVQHPRLQIMNHPQGTHSMRVMSTANNASLDKEHTRLDGGHPPIGPSTSRREAPLRIRNSPSSPNLGGSIGDSPFLLTRGALANSFGTFHLHSGSLTSFIRSGAIGKVPPIEQHNPASTGSPSELALNATESFFKDAAYDSELSSAGSSSSDRAAPTASEWPITIQQVFFVTNVYFEGRCIPIFFNEALSIYEFHPLVEIVDVRWVESEASSRAAVIEVQFAFENEALREAVHDALNKFLLYHTAALELDLTDPDAHVRSPLIIAATNHVLSYLRSSNNREKPYLELFPCRVRPIVEIALLHDSFLELFPPEFCHRITGASVSFPTPDDVETFRLRYRVNYSELCFSPETVLTFVRPRLMYVVAVHFETPPSVQKTAINLVLGDLRCTPLSATVEAYAGSSSSSSGVNEFLYIDVEDLRDLVGASILNLEPLAALLVPNQQSKKTLRNRKDLEDTLFRSIERRYSTHIVSSQNPLDPTATAVLWYANPVQDGLFYRIHTSDFLNDDKKSTPLCTLHVEYHEQRSKWYLDQVDGSVVSAPIRSSLPDQVIETVVGRDIFFSS